MGATLCPRCEKAEATDPFTGWCQGCVDNYDGPLADGGDCTTGAEMAGEQWAEQYEIYTGLK